MNRGSIVVSFDLMLLGAHNMWFGVALDEMLLQGSLLKLFQGVLSTSSMSL